MDYGRLLTDAWKITWRTKYVWLLGFLASLGQGLASAAGIWSNNLIFSAAAEGGEFGTLFENWLDPAAWQPGQILTWAAVVLTAFFIIFLLYWLLVVWADGAVISAALQWAKGSPASLADSARSGRKYLPRFIAVDAVVYFPLFIIALLFLLAAGAAAAAGIISSVQSPLAASPANLWQIAGFCLLPLLCLAIPLGILTSLFRKLAFRQTAVSMSAAKETAVPQNSIRAILKQTWQAARSNWSAVFLVAVLLWALTYLVRTAVSMIALPIYFLAVLPAVDSSIFPGASGQALMLVASGGLSLLIIAVLALVHAYTAVVWTLAYLEFIHLD